MSDPLAHSGRCATLLLFNLGALGGLIGCGSGPLQPPQISPTQIAAQAIKDCDKNGDGFLDGDELELCPGLKSQLPVIDTNNDGKLSADEIAARLTKMVDAKIALIGVYVGVKLDEQPLTGATVRFVPEKFMGDSVKPATGITDQNGRANMKLEEGGKNGVQWGYYRIEVSKKDEEGNETLPARYNSNTTLGCEISPDMRGNLSLKLSS